MLLLVLVSLLALGGIAWAGGETGGSGDPPAPDDVWEARRLAMVASQIEARRVRDPAVLEAMRTVPRHLFVPPEYREQAYADHPRNYLPSQIIFPPNAQARADAEKKIWEMDGAVDAVSTANRALFKIMTALRIRPDAILGHSSGELVALEASEGVILEEEQDVIGHIRTGNKIIEALAAEDSIPPGQLLTVALER